MMKIAQVKVWKEDLQITQPYAISYKVVDKMESVAVQIITESGMYGLGAANPSKYVVGKDVNQTFAEMSGEQLNWLIGQDARQLHHLLNEVERRHGDNAGVVAALDIALHDLFTKHLDIPLAHYLGQRIQSMPTSITIGIKNVAETISEAAGYVEEGFQILKVKLGHSVEEDIERMLGLRQRFGQNVRIVVDANQGYTVTDLELFYHKTKDLNIELIEQPLAANAEGNAQMRQLDPAIRQLVAADETLVSPQDAFKLATPSPACGFFNIKLMKCGGIRPAQQIAAIAQQAGVGLMWGCNSESLVSITAALHVAFSCSNTQFIDLDGSLDLATDLAKGGFIIENGILRIDDSRAGLGVYL